MRARNTDQTDWLEPVLKRLAARGEPETDPDWSAYDSEVVDQETEARLIRVLELYENDALPVEDPQCAAIHAWRLLARRGTAACVPQLVSSLRYAHDDEWALEELPGLIARFGGAGIPPLRRELLEEPAFAADLDALAGIIEALEHIGLEHDDQRAVVCTVLRDALRASLDNHPELNAHLISSLLDLGDTGGIPEITAAFAHDMVATEIEDWPSVHRELGVPAKAPDRIRPSSDMPEYAGDQTMNKLLRAAGSHLNCDELRCLVLGTILAVELVPPSQLFAQVMQDQEGEPVKFCTEGQAQRVLGQVMALWNEVAPYQERLFELPPLPSEPAGIGAYSFQLVRSIVQRMHVHAFLDGFEAGSRNLRDSALWLEFTVELQRRMDHLAGLGKQTETEQTETVGPTKQAEQAEQASAAEIAAAIDSLRAYWATNYSHFAASCKAARRERIRKHELRTAHGKVGRNDPCPCGSGKKFKFCCMM